MILFLYGEDSYRLQKRLDFLRQGFIKKYDSTGLSVEILDAGNLIIDDFRKIVLSTGLLTSRKYIVVKNIFKATDKLNEGILEVWDKVAKDIVLIFTDTELPKKETDMSKKLKQADKTEIFNLLKGNQINDFVRQEVKKYEGQINQDAGNYLVQAIGNDLWKMSGEIQKLINFDKKITLENVEKFVASAVDDNIFNFTDALSTKNAKLALKLLHDQIESGANEFFLISMIARQLKILLQVKETGGKGLDLHPFVIKKTLPQVNKFSSSQLKQLLNKLIDIDIKLKTSSLEPKVLLDLFVLEACE